MGTKPCPDCGSQVSEAAGNCPICRRFLTHRSLEMVSRGVFFFGHHSVDGLRRPAELSPASF